MNQDNHFEKHFDYGSFLPMVLFILGIYLCFLFLNEKNSQAIFIMMFAFVVYVINNLFDNLKENSTVFNEYLEDMAVFVAFSIAPILFGLKFYQDNIFILLIVFFYSICQILNLARNSVLTAKNSKGWPAPLNGLFFPLTYYIYLFYLHGPGNSVFIIYFIIVGILSVSEYNFLGYDRSEEKQERQSSSNVENIQSMGWREEVAREKEIQKKRDEELENARLKELLRQKNEEEMQLRLEKEKKVVTDIITKKEDSIEKKKWYNLSSILVRKQKKTEDKL